MLSTLLTLISGVLGLFWSVKARNSFTKLTGIFLSLSSISTAVGYAGVERYATYGLAIFCLMAAYEPSESKRIKSSQKTYFGFSGILFSVISIDEHLYLPFDLTLWPLVIVFFVATVWVFTLGFKMIRTRLAYICVWVAHGLIGLIDAF